MSEAEPVRSVLFSLDIAEAKLTVVANEVEHTEVRLGKWTAPLYICTKAVGCEHEAECPHAKPHKERSACRYAWINGLGLRYNSNGRLSIEDPDTVPFVLPIMVGGTYLDASTPAAISYWYRTHHDQNSLPYSYKSRTGRWCTRCVAIADSRKFIPMKKARLTSRVGEVICPSVIASCVGRCNHAIPHTKSKFCKDLFPNSEVNLHCRSVNTKRIKRGLLFETAIHACQI